MVGMTVVSAKLSGVESISSLWFYLSLVLPELVST